MPLGEEIPLERWHQRGVPLDGRPGPIGHVPKFRPEYWSVWLFSTENQISVKRRKIRPTLLCNVHSIRKLHYALSISTEINDLGWPWAAFTRSDAQSMQQLNHEDSLNVDRPPLVSVGGKNVAHGQFKWLRHRTVSCDSTAFSCYYSYAEFNCIIIARLSKLIYFITRDSRNCYSAS